MTKTGTRRMPTASQPRLGVQCLAHGGVIRGPGTGTSDSISADAEPGTYVQPADTTKVLVSNGESAFTPKQQQALGSAVMETVRRMTHEPVAKQKRANAGAYADGGTVRPPPPPAPPPVPQLGGMAGAAQGILRGRGKQIDDAAGFADGGLVTDDERKKRAPGLGVSVPTAPAPQPVDDVQLARDSTMSYGDQMSNVGGALARGVATGLKTIVSAPGYGFNAPAPAPAPVATVDAGAGRGTVNPPAVVPTVDTTGIGAGRGSINPPLVSAEARPDLAATPNLNGDVGLGVPGASGVRRITTPGGGTLYSNVPGDNAGQGYGVSVAGGDDVTGRNLRAANIYASMREGQAGGSYIPGVNAPASQYEQETAARNAGVVSNVAGISAREQARLDNARRIAAESNATSRANNQDSNATAAQGQQTAAQTTRYGVDAAAATAANKLAIETPEQVAKTQLAVSTLAARKEYADALASGDAKRVSRAEDNLRAIQGKYEKEARPVRQLVVPGGQQVIDGQLVHAPSQVYDPDTGKFIAPPSPAAAPAAGAVAATPRSDYDKLPRGAKYIGPDGKQYIKG